MNKAQVQSAVIVCEESEAANSFAFKVELKNVLAITISFRKAKIPYEAQEERISTKNHAVLGLMIKPLMIV